MQLNVVEVACQVLPVGYAGWEEVVVTALVCHGWHWHVLFLDVAQQAASCKVDSCDNVRQVLVWM